MAWRRGATTSSIPISSKIPRSREEVAALVIESLRCGFQAMKTDHATQRWSVSLLPHL